MSSHTSQGSLTKRFQSRIFILITAIGGVAFWCCLGTLIIGLIRNNTSEGKVTSITGAEVQAAAQTEQTLPTGSPTPTRTLAPTHTPLPTSTPQPTSTPTSTHTPAPTPAPLGLIDRAAAMADIEPEAGVSSGFPVIEVESQGD